MFSHQDCGSTSRLANRRRCTRSRSRLPEVGALEERQLLTLPTAIVPGQIYQDVAFLDARGNTVEIAVNGTTTGAAGFTVRLAGDATSLADVDSLNLVGLSGQNGLSITVTPNELTINAGSDYYNKMFSAGYTNIAKITAADDTTTLGNIQLGAAIVGDINLPNVAMGRITLDTGMVTYVDRVNTSTLASSSSNSPTITITSPLTGEQEIVDENMVGAGGQYNPAAGLIDLYNVEAKSISSIVVNGSISATTNDPFDETQLTNDLRGIVDVSGNIGSIVAPRGALRNAVRAGGIGSIQIGQINGEITTRDVSQPLTIALPLQFTGFLNVAGHLNLGFAGSTAEKDTGNISAGGGISGSDPSQADSIFVPDKLATSIVDTSTTQGIADIVFNGTAFSRWYSASSIGNITAQVLDASSLFEAGTDIGDVEMLMPTTVATGTAAQTQTRSAVNLDGFIKAGGNIGDVKSATGIKAQLIAGGNIGTITGVSGGLESTVVLAGGNIGDITVYQPAVSLTEISAGGEIGDIRAYSGSIGWRVKAHDIGNILVDAGSLNLAVFVAANDLGDVTVTNPDQTAMDGGSLIAGHNIGDVTVYAFNGTAIDGTLIQAGNRISSVTGISYGSVILPSVSAGVPSSVAHTNNGINQAQILAAEMGAIKGQGYVGTGLYKVVIHAQVGNIDSITGIGNGDGIYEPVVVAEGGIGPITGQSTVLGSGIEGGSFDANGKTSASLGTMGQITAQGGPAGGDGIYGTRFQASNRIAGIDSTVNANGGDALYAISTYAQSYGDIKALVLGGQTGNGIIDSSLRAWTDYENNRPDVQVDGIYVDVRSGLGMGISNSIFQVKGDITNLQVKALNGSAISRSNFSISQGDFGRIYAESINSGTAISNSIFMADNGSITSARDQASALTSGITAIASGTSILSDAISGSSFTADGNIGFISATTKGGTAISGSIFVADSDYGNSMNGPNLPNTTPDTTDLGAIFGIYAKTAGQHLVSSAGISGSSFEGERIDSITVEVTDREQGGAGISASIFNGRNAVYDNNGNFNNAGTIGTITVVDGSLRGNGIEDSQFLAGAAGSIGNINVTTLGGAGIRNSEFRASQFDYDQSLFTSTIGNITVTTGRSSTGLLPVQPPPNDGWTLLAAGIDTSYFAADAGIGNLNVNSIGTGVFLSAFLADFDVLTRFGTIPGFILPFFADNVPGNMGNVNITTNGRFAFGSVFSVYSGASVGNININISPLNSGQQVGSAAAALTTPTSADVTLNVPDLTASKAGTLVNFLTNAASFSLRSIIGPSASAGSLYLATDGDIGRINVANAGPGFDSFVSGYIALPYGNYGPVAPFDSSFLNVFWGRARKAAGAQEPASVAPNSLTAPASSTYRAGDTLYFSVGFTGSVNVTGQPSIPVQVGSVIRQALYDSGSGASQLRFSLQLEPGDSGDVFIPAGTVLHTELSDRITESATGMELTELAVPSLSPGTIRIDSTAPTVVSVSPIQHAGKRYSVGQLLSIDVTFSESVIVSGFPIIPLTIGGMNRAFTYAGGSGTNTLHFTYRLTRADLAGAKSATTTGQIVLPTGVSITDAAGNKASLPPLSSTTTSVSTTTTKTTASRRIVARTKAVHPAGPLAAKRRVAVGRKV
ncbi:beta strand repeat-containing protein [Aquisphaera insulae]|uniref:beta strand repeat-containing protein n=1 Tax=Aquisphaera insulae TaxID=2712864 RepID=UPI0013EB6F9E|nr:hypothetical protein [Aquisphaera insulae]